MFKKKGSCQLSKYKTYISCYHDKIIVIRQFFFTIKINIIIKKIIGLEKYNIKEMMRGI